MCLNDRRPKGIWQAVKWRAISDGFKESFEDHGSKHATLQAHYEHFE